MALVPGGSVHCKMYLAITSPNATVLGAQRFELEPNGPPGPVSPLPPPMPVQLRPRLKHAENTPIPMPPTTTPSVGFLKLGTVDDSIEINGKYIEQTTDGGYIFIGLTDSAAAYYYNFYIIKTDSYGNMLWNHGYKINGYNLVIARNGFEGVEILKNIKPDLILLDLVMPKMGGMEFYNHTCGVDGKPLYPIVVVSAHSELIEIFKNLDVEGILMKPIFFEDLLVKIENIFNSFNLLDKYL